MGNKCNTKLFSSILIAFVICGGFLPYIGQNSRVILPIVVFKDNYEENDTWDQNTYIDSTYPGSSQGELNDHVYIDGNEDLSYLKAQGNITGEGTEENPYILEDLVIDMDFSGAAIDVRNTDKYLIIDNCTILNSGVLNDDGDVGINIGSCSNIKIMNCVLENNEGAIGLYQNSYDNTIINNTILNTNGFGLTISGAHHNEILNNTLINNYGYAVSTWEAEYNVISGNIFTDNHGGIQLEYSPSNIISENEMNGSIEENGIKLYFSNENNISNNTILDGISGISLDNSENTIIFDNKISNTGISDEQYAGIQINSCSNITIMNCTLDNNERAISADGDSIDITIINNVVLNSTGFGITVSGSQKKILDNVIKYTDGFAIELFFAENNIITGNIMISNFGGIAIAYSDYNTISENELSGEYGGGDGISLSSSNKNIITRNTITTHLDGIYLSESSKNNIIYFNDIYRNFQNQAFEESGCSGNQWDNGTVGNYWGNSYSSRYPDAENDGTVWDTSYEIDGEGRGKDNIPLVNKFSDSDISELIKAGNQKFYILLGFLLIGIGLILGLTIKYRSNLAKKIKVIFSGNKYKDQPDKDKEKEKEKVDEPEKIDREEPIKELTKEQILFKTQIDTTDKLVKKDVTPIKIKEISSSIEYIDQPDKEKEKEKVDEPEKVDRVESLVEISKEQIEFKPQIDTSAKLVKEDVIPIKISNSEENLTQVPDPYKKGEKEKTSDIFNVIYIISQLILIIILLNF